MNYRIATAIFALSLAAVFAAGCGPGFKNSTDENEHFKCTMDIVHAGSTTNSPVSYSINCIAKKGRIEFRNLKLTYSDRSSRRTSRRSRGSSVLAVSEPFGDNAIEVTPQKPFSHKGTISPRGRLIPRYSHRNLTLSANVFYPDDPYSNDELDKREKKDPTKYRMSVSKGL